MSCSLTLHLPGLIDSTAYWHHTWMLYTVDLVLLSACLSCLSVCLFRAYDLLQVVGKPQKVYFDEKMAMNTSNRGKFEVESSNVQGQWKRTCKNRPTLRHVCLSNPLMRILSSLMGNVYR